MASLPTVQLEINDSADEISLPFELIDDVDLAGLSKMVNNIHVFMTFNHVKRIRTYYVGQAKKYVILMIRS